MPAVCAFAAGLQAPHGEFISRLAKPPSQPASPASVTTTPTGGKSLSCPHYGPLRPARSAIAGGEESFRRRMGPAGGTTVRDEDAPRRALWLGIYPPHRPPIPR
jgi:hypothetical protein